MGVPLYDTGGEKIGEVELSAAIFGAPINIPLMHQALEYQLANLRSGTHGTKSRGEVNRSKMKWYRQKGTGRARHGSRNANLFVGGGIAHGPKPRSYRKRMPRKMRRAALRSALSVKANDEQVKLVDALSVESSKTKEMVVLLQKLGLEGSVLVLLAGQNDAVETAARNLDQVKALRVNYVNVRDLFTYDDVLIPVDALRVIESILG